MRMFLEVLLQIVLAIVLAGALLPLVLFTLPQAQAFGPILATAAIVALFFGLRRVWPKREPS